MFKAIIDDVTDFFKSLFKKEGRFHLIIGILSIVYSFLEVLLFSLIFPRFNLIFFVIYSIALYYGFYFLTKYLQKILIKMKIIKYTPDDFTYNGTGDANDNRLKNNLDYKAAVDHYGAIKAYVIIFTISAFLYLFVATPYGIFARLIFCLIIGFVMYFITIEPVEHIDGTDHQEQKLVDKIKDGLGLGESKEQTGLSKITNVINDFKQSELQQQQQLEPQQAAQVNPEPEYETLEERAITDDYYQNSRN